MKANELMLGDYVTFADCQKDKYPSIVKIWQINEAGEAFVSIDGDEALEEIDIDDEIVGIPITPEILKENGFINGEFYAESLIEDWQILSDCSHLAARHSSGWCLDIQCEYVHELQHAFRLFKLGKEIEL